MVHEKEILCRQKSAKLASDHPLKQSPFASASRSKSTSNVRNMGDGNKTHHRTRGNEGGLRPSGLPPKSMPHTKSVSHLQKVISLLKSCFYRRDLLWVSVPASPLNEI